MTDMGCSPRVIVIGSSGAGKTTFARALSRRLVIPHFELDALHWGPDWRAESREVFRARVADVMTAPAWVMDGNYSVVRDLVWARATSLIWLNYPFRVVYRRGVGRTLRRIVTQEELFQGNRESLRNLLHPEGIPWWILRTFWKLRREFPILFQQPEFVHLQRIEFQQPKQAEQFLQEVFTENKPH